MREETAHAIADIALGDILEYDPATHTASPTIDRKLLDALATLRPHMLRLELRLAVAAAWNALNLLQGYADQIQRLGDAVATWPGEPPVTIGEITCQRKRA